MIQQGLQQRSSCEKCGFAKWGETNGKKIQIGCKVSQIDKLKELKTKVDPNGDEVDNSLFKLNVVGNTTCYVLNMLCVFQRSQEWIENHIFDDDIRTTETLRQAVFKTIPFMYHAIVVYDGNMRQTMKTVKSIMNGTVPPLSLSVIIPVEHNDKDKIEEVILAMRERIGKDINRPNDFNWEVRPMRSEATDTLSGRRLQISEAVQSKPGSFYILILDEGSRIHEQFIESIKNQSVNHFVDFHIINLSPTESLLVHPVFDGTCGLVPSACFTVDTNGVLKQEFNINNIRSFFNVVD